MLSVNKLTAAWINEIIHLLPLGVHQYELRKDRLIFTGGNKAADEILGIDHKTLIGKTLEEAFPPLMKTEIPAQYRQVALSGKSWETEQVVYEDKVISGAFQVYAIQTLPGRMAAMFRDITEKKKSEAALQSSEQKLRMLFDNMAQGVMYFNSDGAITEINNAACHILGLDRKEILSRNIRDIRWETSREDGTALNPDELPALLAFKSGKPVKQSIVGVFNPFLKQNRWLMIDAIPEYKPGVKKPSSVFITFSDVTDQKNAELDLRRYNTELETTRMELDKSLQSLAAVNQSLLEMQVTLESKNTELKEKNEEFCKLNMEYEMQNEQLKETNASLEKTNARIIEISQRIRHNEQQVRTILENSKDIIYSINYTTGAFEYVSPVIKEILGLPDKDFLQKKPGTLFDRMHPDDIRQFGKHWQEIIELEEKDIFLFEIGYRLKDNTGNYHWMSENNKMLRDEEGQPLYLIGSIRDITELKNSDIALRASEERLALAIEATDQGLWDIHVKQDSGYFSSRCFAILGFTTGEIPFTSENIFSRIHPDDKEFIISNMSPPAFGAENMIRLEFRILHKKGEYIWMLSRGKCVERDEKGNPLRILGTFSDITERKTFELTLRRKNEELQAAEEELRITNEELMQLNIKQKMQNRELQETYQKLKVSEENFKQLADNIEDIFWLVEGKKLIYVSSAFEKVTGIGREEAMQHTESILAMLHPGDKKAHGFVDMDAIKSDGFSTDQFSIIKPDGTTRWLWSRVFPVFDRDGKIYRLAGIASDITIQKELESELREAKDKAQESDRLKSAFLANISHEIRTPMNGIIGFTGLLTRTAPDDESRNRYLEIINKSSDQLLHIIDDLIDISKIEANQVKVTYNACDINALLDDIHLFYSRELVQADKSQIELIPAYSLPDEQAHIVTDSLRLRQIMGNLMSNAVKFTEKGYIRFGYEMEGREQIRFFVEDSGIGIDPSKAEIIFQPFRQVDEGDARKFGGTGLGLSISLGFVKMMKGKMWFDSTPGKGTSFYFSLPYRSAFMKEHHDTEIRVSEGVLWGEKHMLIVEDDDLNYEYLSAILEPTAIDIQRAKDGIQAIDMCKAGKFDLVLMDIRIPRLDGFKTTRKLREAGFDLPVIAQTAFAMANDKDKCIEAGCNDYIAKPVNKDLLIRMLSKYLMGDS